MRDLGSEGLAWSDLKVILQNLPPDSSSAVFRAKNPRSWWWDASVDFQAALLHSLQLSNWQRGGGKGAQPKPVKRPTERVQVDGERYAPTTPEDLAKRRADRMAMLAKRAQQTLED